MDNVTQPTSSAASGAGAAPVPESDLTGKTLGDFHVLRRLGQGGMGQVYLAEQLSLKRKVALKIMRPDLAANDTALKRFKLEAEAIARITHANIVQVYAFEESEGLHYMALEYVEGRNLREYLAKKGPPEVLLALSIMRQVAAALQRASEVGIIHRDIKPENILLTRKGEAKVTDFGLSRCFAGEQQPMNITQSGVTMGTPLYMSPEQVQGKPVDPRTDVYSFGVTCYHMLAGQPPFHGQTPFEVAVQHVQNEPVPLTKVRPDLPAELCAVVHKMMAKEPENRYQSGRDLLKDLTRLRDSLSGAAAGPEMPAVSMSQSKPLLKVPLTTLLMPVLGRRRWLRWAVGLSLLLALLAGAAFRLWPRPASIALPPPAVAGEPDLPLPTLREKFLLEELKREFNPKDPRQVKRDLDHRIDLALLYLEQDRRDEADRLFRELINNPPHQDKRYSALGKVGQAIVLAFQDRAVESNKLFQEFVRTIRPFEKKRLEGNWMLLAHPELQAKIAEALDRNAANATAKDPFPPQLEGLRRIPVPSTPPGKARKNGPESKPAGKDS